MMPVIERSEDDVLSACALRFDGYTYEEATGIGETDSVGAGLAKLIKPIVETRTFQDDQNVNLAAFFGLQRFLYKWGGEYLTEFADEHVVFRLLFLHLYRADIPAQFRKEPYAADWEREYSPHREHYAAAIRATLCRRGEGPTLQI
jgi:hypothetical protein